MMIIALVGGILILSFILKMVLFKAYDKVRNGYVMGKNAGRQPEMSRLSDQHNPPGSGSSQSGGAPDWRIR